MTKEEASNILDDYDVNFEGHTEEEVAKAFDVAPSVIPKGVTVTDFADRCRECGREKVLDKIRAEIEALEDGITSYRNDRPWIFKDEALQIIDKYKAEMESEE